MLPEKSEANETAETYLAKADGRKSPAMVLQDLLPWGHDAGVVTACGNRKTRN